MAETDGDRMLFRDMKEMAQYAERLSDRLRTSALEIDAMVERSYRLIRECRETLDSLKTPTLKWPGANRSH